MEILTIALSIFASMVSGMALFFMQRYFKSKDKKDDVRDIEKAKENVLILKSIDALGKLTYANSIAIRDGKTNGEMKEGVSAYIEVKEDMYNYLLENNSKK